MEPTATRIISEVTVTEIITYIIITVIIGQLWLRAFENLAYQSLGYSKTSWYVALILAIAATILFIILSLNFMVIMRELRLEFSP